VNIIVLSVKMNGSMTLRSHVTATIRNPVASVSRREEMSMTKQVCSCKVSDNGYVFRLHTPDCPTQSKPNRVEIWRYNDRTLTVAHSDGSCWNGPDGACKVKHEGIWNCAQMKFLPSDRFTDGTPVALYEGLETLEDGERSLSCLS
jgi:hypothetical protein